LYLLTTRLLAVEKLARYAFGTHALRKFLRESVGPVLARGVSGAMGNRRLSL